MAEGTSWNVTGQREDFRADENGDYGNGIVVSFMTNKGNRGSVFVPMKDYQPQRVRELVAAKAAQMDAVSDLTGG